MNIDTLVQNLSPQVYEKLLQAVETGKWLDGSTLTDQQKNTCMQGVILYQSKVLKSEQHMTVGHNGEIVHKSRADFKQEFQQTSNNDQTIARFKQNDI